VKAGGCFLFLEDQYDNEFIITSRVVRLNVDCPIILLRAFSKAHQGKIQNMKTPLVVRVVAGFMLGLVTEFISVDLVDIDAVESLLGTLVYSIPLVALCLLTGCGTLPSGRGWGQDAIYPVQWSRIPQAAKHALLDPVTLVTAGGAAVIAIGNYDHKISNWATDHQPIFGSTSSAQKASDIFGDALRAETAATLLLTPSGDDAWEWTEGKVKGGAVEFGSLLATSSLTDVIKSAAHRERPDGSDYSSFPSAASSEAFANMRLSDRNLDCIDMPSWARTSIKAGNLTLASATAWARVEGGSHYPTDVLVGACLGNVVTTFIHDAFLNLPEDSTFSFRVEPSPHGV
jgi:hypothetical protein